MNYCYKHADRDSVSDCTGCKKHICEECIELKEGDKSFCYDCAINRHISDYRDKSEYDDQKAFDAGDEKGFSTWFKVFAPLLSVLIIASLVLIVYEHMSKEGIARYSAEQETIWDRDECILTLQALRVFLSEHKDNYGDYPLSLEDIEEIARSEALACPSTGEIYRYEKTAGGYSLFCPNPELHGAQEVGANNKGIPFFRQEVPNRDDS